MIRVIARFSLKPGNAEKAVEIAKPLIDLTRKETGCVQYDLVQSNTNENVMVMLEIWEDQHCLDTHSASEHFNKYVPELAALCESAPVVESFKQVV